jgi:hypothetical protein
MNQPVSDQRMLAYIEMLEEIVENYDHRNSPTDCDDVFHDWLEQRYETIRAFG